MNVRKVIHFVGKFVNKLEPEFTFKLIDIIYSNSHGHEICVMQLVGKNAFPLYTAAELISSPQGMIGLSPRDAVRITQLDCQIKERQQKSKVLEIDRNGTIVLRDRSGNIKRYSERMISSDRGMLKDLLSEDAHDIGYRVGFKDGMELKKQKTQLTTSLRSKILKLIRD